MSHLIFTIIFSLLILPGVFLTFIPMVPAFTYMSVFALLYGFLDGFQHLTWPRLAILGAIFLLAILNDYLCGALGAKLAGASKKSILYGFAGLIVGVIVFPPFGGLFGLFAGVLISEFISHKDEVRAVKTAAGSLIGALAGMVVNAILALGFFILFLVFSL